MKCDLCDNEAVVHHTVIRNKVPHTEHLCQGHALQRGLAVTALGMGAPVAKVKVTLKSTSAAAEPEGRCPSCGLTIAEYRKAALLGCPACYAAFGEFLAQVIQASQAGAQAHIGVTPPGESAGAAIRARRQSLLKALEAAIVQEQYEQAARLRDELRGHDPAEGA